MLVTPLASTVSDNWFYAIEDAGDLLLIDPIDPAVAIAHVRKRAPKRVRILNTHGHPDHVGGNDAVVDELQCEVIASKHPDIFDPPAQQHVGEGDTVQVGDTTWKVLHAPGHTMGHIVLHHPGALICGDVYFVGGIGNCRFGGDPATLHETVSSRLASLPDDTRIYPGHDYAIRNLEFCLEVEPQNARAAAYMEKAKQHHGDDPRRAPFLTTLGEERSYNPFHRVKDTALQATLAKNLAPQWPSDDEDTARAAFRALRSARDAF